MILSQLTETVRSYSSAEYSAFADMVVALAVIVGGGWALYNYHRVRRNEAAQWLKQLFDEFYGDDKFANIRKCLEYTYDENFGLLIERRVTNREIPLKANEDDLLVELDTLLNYFEFLVYLQEERHMSKKDRLALFEYWFDLLSGPHKGGLRRYIGELGFERIAAELHVPDGDRVMLYGSLMQRVGGLGKIDIAELLEPKGDCYVRGVIRDLGEYPGLTLSPEEESRKLAPDLVHGELYEIKRGQREKLFALMDEFERFRVADRAKSLFIRRCVRLEDKKDAWVYVYNGDVGGPRIDCGSWSAHLERLTGHGASDGLKSGNRMSG